MNTRSMASQRASFLPAGVKSFARRRAVEAGGIALFVAAAGLALALASHNSADPNFNLATGRAPSNVMGLPGAYVADILVQTLGIAGALPVPALIAWGWRLMSHRGLPWWWLNLALLPVAMLLAASFAATLPPPAGWPLKTGLGGVLGQLALHAQAVPFARLFGAAPAPMLLGIGCAALALAALVGALGLGASEWRIIGRGVGDGVRVTGSGLYHGGRALGRAGEGFSYLRERIDDGLAGLRREPRLRRAEDDEAEAEAGPRLRRRAGGEGAARPVLRGEDRRGEDRRGEERRVERRLDKPKTGKRAAQAAQPALDLARPGEFQLPALGLLKLPPHAGRGETVNEDALEQNARLLESVLGEFGVQGEIVKVRPGPVVTLYELEPAPGTKSSRVIGLADDIARSMSALSARVAVIPGRNAIGIELPNARRETVYLRELLATAEYESTAARLTLALGKDIGGAPVFADLARMPHLLVAGTTGSGKSVAINTMILSLLYRLTPDQCRFIMVDPKMLELSVYDGIPHLLAPVVTEPGKAVVALKWTVREMEERYRKMSELGVRNIAGYNQRLAEARARGEKLSRTVQTGFDAESGEPIFEERLLDLAPLPLIVVIVDELADLMIVAGKDIEAAMQRLAQMARAAGIHLIVATQRPSVDVITGTIKANFPTRISFQVTSKIDSRTILGEQGAEQLLGMGDMLFMPSAGRITRVHGPLVTDAEVEEVVSSLKAQGEPDFVDGVTAEPEERLPGLGGEDEGGDELYDQAVALVCRERKASTSFVQRHLQIGYNRAARIIERMEKEGVVGPANHVGKREVLARDIDDRAR
jgi:S-DNA-T family DNA segregation ATPase FtsK/SpoIIIE